MTILIIALAVGALVIGTLPASASAVELESPPVDVIPDDIPSNLAPAVAAAQAAITIGVAAAAITVADRLLSNYNAQKARISAEGEWAGQIRVFLNSIPSELYLEASVQDIAVAIVTFFGYGGSWRIGFPDPVRGMTWVLTVFLQPTLNLRSINLEYQRGLARANSISDIDAANANHPYSGIVELGIEPWATEMRAFNLSAPKPFPEKPATAAELPGALIQAFAARFL